MWYTVYQYPQITILIVKWWSTRSSFQKWLICYLLSALIVFATGLKKNTQLGGIQNWVSFSANDRQALLSIARRERRSRRCMEHLVWVQTARKAQSTWQTFQRILHAPFRLPNPYMSDISIPEDPAECCSRLPTSPADLAPRWIRQMICNPKKSVHSMASYIVLYPMDSYGTLWYFVICIWGNAVKA